MIEQVENRRVGEVTVVPSLTVTVMRLTEGLPEIRPCACL